MYIVCLVYFHIGHIWKTKKNKQQTNKKIPLYILYLRSMKDFQVKHLPQETQTFISKSFYCWMKTSENAMLSEIRNESCSQGLVKWTLPQRARLSTPLCPGGVFLFSHHLGTEKDLSVGLQLQVTPSNQCAPLVESWGNFRVESLSGEASPFLLRR